MGDDEHTRPPEPPLPSATQKQQLEATKSWVGKFIRDMYPLDDNRQFGLVIDVEAQDKDLEEGPRLIVRFPGEERARRVALSPSRDGHYLYGPDPKARYRLPSEADNERLRALGRGEAVKKPEKSRRPLTDAGSHIKVKPSNQAVARSTGANTPTSLPAPTAVIRSRLTIELPKELPALKRQAALDTIRSQFETILCDLLVECLEERPGLQDILHMKSSITGEQTVLAVAEVCLPARQPARALVDEAAGDLIDFFTREGDPERFDVILASGPVRYVAKGFRIAVTYKGRRHLERRGVIPLK